MRDRETEGHSQRVADMTLKMARELGFSDVELVHVRRGSLLHDIGKMGIPDYILHKPGALTDEEWEIILKYIQEESGKHFDPKVVEVFLRHLCLDGS